jgi:hypothetical protein
MILRRNNLTAILRAFSFYHLTIVNIFNLPLNDPYKSFSALTVYLNDGSGVLKYFSLLRFIERKIVSLEAVIVSSKKEIP